MKIYGLNKTTLLDYPEHLAATIFLGGCNLRCPYCHNSSLVFMTDIEAVYTEEEILSFLKKRKTLLEGVCITGGEPTLSPELPIFIRKIKELGYKIKLDTNGSKPDVIKTLVSEKLIDYVAMDIKTSPQKYEWITGIKNLPLQPILESASYLLENHIDYEFRTTIVNELHSEKEIIEIGRWIQGCKRYFLQPYKDSDNVIVKGFTTPDSETLDKFKNILLQYIDYVSVRGQ